MKNILIIIITILSIISISSISISIYFAKNYIKVPSQYKCEREENDEIINYKREVIININKEQYVENYQNIDIKTYLVKELYEQFKEIVKNDELIYLYEDNNQTVTIKHDIDYIKNEQGEKIDFWYKEYIKNMESIGYICQIQK